MSSLLSYYQLLNLIKDGVIQNSAPEHVNGASIDVTLGPTLLLETKPNIGRDGERHPISFRHRDPLPTTSYTMDNEQGYTLQPGEFVLGHTEQIFNMPISLAAEFSMRSSSGRIALEHMNSGWCDPGWINSALTLELCNCSRYTPITIRPGDRIGQMKFFRVTGVPKAHGYGARGRYNNDKTVQGVKR